MTALGFQTIGGLETIESGLNDLRRSQLMIIPEFKSMYGAILKHLNDLKFAHITGKARDLLDQAFRDTKFYNILIKMLCEVKQRRTGEQRAGLRQVYTWYQANKHVLYCGPRFGKDYMREQAKEILHKSLSVKNKKRSVSARERSTKDRNPSALGVIDKADSNNAKENLDPSSDLDVKAPANRNVSNVASNVQIRHVTMAESMVSEQDDSSYTLSDPVMTRPKSAISVTISHLNEKSGSNVPPNVRKVTTMIHPLSTLVNPHAHTAIHSEESSNNQKNGFISHIAAGSKPDNLQVWQAFNKNRAYGQDIIGKLNFVGRSGTAFDVRYAAHSQGEAPEDYTKELMNQHVKELKSLENVPSSEEDEENYFVHQTLEEFYQTADVMRPTTRGSSRMSSHDRALSARSVKREKNQATLLEVPSRTKSPLKLGHQLDIIPNNNKPVTTPAKDTGLKLNTVVHKIDSVSEEMTYFKEKLIPQPQHGFRQPSATGLPTPRDEVSTSTNYLVQSSSDFSMVQSRPVTSSCTTDLEHPAGEIRKAKLRCKSASGIDWRGKIEPDTIRYKWSKTKFGSHTYLKKWINSHAQNNDISPVKKRPKTAPSTAKEKWKTSKEANVRAVQAASHVSTVVDQKELDNMMTIQHLLPGDDGVDPRSLYDYDQKFWKNARKSSSAVETPKEFLSFVTPSANMLADQKCLVNKNIKSDIGGVEAQTSFVSEDQTTRETLGEQITKGENLFSESFLPEKNTVQDAAEERIPQFLDTPLSNTGQVPQEQTEDFLDFSGKWHLSTDKEIYNLDKSAEVWSHQFSDVQLDQDLLCTDCQPNMKTARVERSAGRMPSRSLSAQLTGHNRVPEILRKAPPIRTPPSIPSPQLNFQMPERRTGQIFLELEHHARRTKSPRSFMQKVEGLRNMSSSYRPMASNYTSNESIVGTSLQVCHLPVAKKATHLHSDYASDFNDKIASHDQSSPNSSSMHNQYMKHKHVSFSDIPEHHKPTSAPSSSPRSSLEESEFLQQRNQILPAPNPPGDSDSTSQLKQPISKIGRPIAQVTQITDPDELAKAAQLQREAAAAVDIQRIFRGYVARTAYKYLVGDARWKKEDEQKVALDIQRMNKEHNKRMNAIYKRAPLSPEIKQWSNDVRSVQLDNAMKRQDKMNTIANEMVLNQKESKNKLSSIGPHVEIYDIYHPKQVGPTIKELNLAAIKIQKIVRGWMVRRKMEKLSRKATWYGSSYSKMAKEYKSMLKQVQNQHGVDKPKTPFSIKEFNNYIDMRRRYESVFDKKAFSGELEISELKSFFTECDLHPSQTEIDEALDVTTHGQAFKSETKGLKKRELLDLLFYIYVPPATGLEGTRKSTWMNPIINGEEGRKLLGSEYVEPAPLEPCAKLVFQAKREQRQREQIMRDAEERKRIEESLQRTEEIKQTKKSKQVTIQDPTV